MDFNLKYRNKTVNKWPRKGYPLPNFVVWHETAGYGSLTWNLTDPPGTSFNYLINRAGVVYEYVDPDEWISYHAGKYSRWLVYEGWAVNVHSIGVEIEGPNNGQPITPAQLESSINLALYFRSKYGIWLDRNHHPEHSEVAPRDTRGNVYKTDPRGVNADTIVIEAAKRLNTKAKTPPAIPHVEGMAVPVSEPVAAFWRNSGGIWQEDRFAYGFLTGTRDTEKGTVYEFERGGMRLNPDGGIDALLLSELV